MSDVIGRGVYEIEADASGLRAAVAEGVAVANAFENKVGQSISAGAQKAATAIEGLDNVTKRYVASVEREVASVALSRSEYRAWEAQVKGISENVYGPLVQRLQAASKARDDDAEAARRAADAERQAARATAEAAAEKQRAARNQEAYLQSLREEVRLNGLTSGQRELYTAGQRGGPEATALVAQLQNQKAAQEALNNAKREEARVTAEAERAQAAEATERQRAQAQQQSYIQGLREEARLIGLTADQREIYNAAQRGGMEGVSAVTELQRRRVAQEALNQSIRDQAQAQQQAQAGLATRADFVADLQRQAQAIGRTKSELLEMRAAELGVANAAAPFIAQLRAQEQALTSVVSKYNAYGQSQKQVNAALRGVPAQITDIVVSLQGGQAPFTVLLQQGGQLKDMFGGIVPAVRALGGALGNLLLNPITAVVAAIGTLGYAYYTASKEQDAFVLSLATTGNRAGASARQLNELSKQVSDIQGSRAGAAEALNALVGAGGVQGVQDLARYAETAARAQKFLATSVTDTAKAYADLAKDPLRATERLGEAHGYLTHSLYTQIRALTEANDLTGAAVIAQRAYDEAVRNAANQVEQNLGLVQRAWNAVKTAVNEATEAVLQFGRTPTNSEALKDIEERLNNARRFDQFMGTGRATKAIEEERNTFNRDALRNTERALTQAAEATLNREKIEAQKRNDALMKATRSRAQIRADEIKEMRADAAKLGLTQDQIAKLEAGINEKYKDRATRKAPAFQDDEATRYLLRLKEIEGALNEQIGVEKKLTDAQRERARFDALIQGIQEKKGPLTDGQKSLVAQQAAIRAQLDINVAKAETIRLQTEEAKAAEKAAQQAQAYADAVDRIRATVATNADSRTEAITKALSGFGRGDAERERLEAQRQLNREFDIYILQLEKAAIANKQAVDPSQIAAVRAAQQAALAENAAYYERLKAMEADWSNGATRAMENYFSDSQNVAQQIEGAFTNAFQGLEDALVEFATTGKLSFSDLATSIVADISRIIIKAQVIGPLTQMLQGGMSSGSGIGGFIQSGLSSLFGGGFTAGGTQGMSWSYPKAGGGYAPPYSRQVVNENGPELLVMGNRQVLQMGGQGGQVVPSGKGEGRQVVLHYHAAPGTDRRTGMQQASDAARMLNAADTRNN